MQPDPVHTVHPVRTLHTVQARSTDDARAFLAHVSDLIESDPIGTNIVASNAAREVASPAPSGDPLWLWVERDRPGARGAAAVAVAMHTPPFRPFVATTEATAAVAIADLLLDSGRAIDGVVGTLEGTRAFAAQWRRRQPCRVITEMRTGVFRLRTLVPPTATAGIARMVVSADEALVRAWSHRFTEDIGLAETDEHAIGVRLATGRLWLWQVDGTPVSMAYATPPSAGVTRIGWVYTPPDERGRGYGSAITARVSADAQARGELCMLHTDLANPTSNKIYLALGYERVGSDAALRFAPVPSAEERVLRAFVGPDGRLVSMPAKAGKRRILLDHIVQSFEVGVRYPEPEVNERLLSFTDDYATLRRALVDEQLLDRAAGTYWRSGGSVEP